MNQEKDVEWVVYTDGSCLGNPGPGGWAYRVLRHGQPQWDASGPSANTTNNRMELQAVIEALESLRLSDAPIHLYTDSQYVKQGMTSWLASWKARGWQTSTKTPVKNIDLWQKLDALASSCRVSWFWVRAHAAITHNEAVDVAARKAATSQKADRAVYHPLPEAVGDAVAGAAPATHAGSLRRCVVTGGGGYVGSHVVLALREAGWEVVIFDRRQPPARLMPALEGVAWVLGDVTDAESCRALFRRYPSEAVVHCAARISVPESCRDPLGYYHHNTAGSATVMDVGREYGVRRWVLSSTAAVYGEGFGNRPIEETMPLIPVNPYGASKMMAEKVWEDGCRAHAMRGVALRYFNVSGADPQGRAGQWDPESGHLITRLLRVALGQQPIFRIFGQDYPTEDGTCVRDYIHVSDLARAHAMALESLQNPAMAESSPLVSGGEWSVYNVGLGRGYSVKQVWEAAERVIGRSIPCEWGPRREGDPARLVASSEAIRRDWGWNPAHAEIESMVSSAWDWMQRWHGAGSSKQCVTT